MTPSRELAAESVAEDDRSEPPTVQAKAIRQE
jgi:hypothetical protein